MPIIKEEVYGDDGSHTVLFDNTKQEPSLDDLVERRNSLQIASQDSDAMWQRLGIANRHITRVVNGILTIEQTRHEIVDCLDRAEKWLKSCSGS